MANREKIKIKLKVMNLDPKRTRFEVVLSSKEISFRKLGPAIGYSEKAIRMAIKAREMPIEMFIVLCEFLDVHPKTFYGDIDEFLQRLGISRK